MRRILHQPKSITFQAEAYVISAAEQGAEEQGSTLAEQFRLWLDAYARETLADNAMRTLRELQDRHMTGGHRFTRDELNER